MEKHYICTGGCKGVSNTTGVCQDKTCEHYQHSLEECNCSASEHVITNQVKKNNIFNHLTVFSYKRSGKEALGFYLAYLLTTTILAGIMGGVVGVFLNPENTDSIYEISASLGAVIALIVSLVISILILKAKKIYKNFGYILLALVGAGLGLVGGGLLGLIVPAFLTTRENIE